MICRDCGEIYISNDLICCHCEMKLEKHMFKHPHWCPDKAGGFGVSYFTQTRDESFEE